MQSDFPITVNSILNSFSCVIIKKHMKKSRNNETLFNFFLGNSLT